jgi:hypothetical protein
MSIAFRSTATRKPRHKPPVNPKHKPPVKTDAEKLRNLEQCEELSSIRARLEQERDELQANARENIGELQGAFDFMRTTRYMEGIEKQTQSNDKATYDDKEDEIIYTTFKLLIQIKKKLRENIKKFRDLKCGSTINGSKSLQHRQLSNTANRLEDPNLNTARDQRQKKWNAAKSGGLRTA